MAGKHHEDPQQIGVFLQTHGTTSGSSLGHKSWGQRKPIQSNRYFHNRCSCVTVATIFLEHAEGFRKLLFLSIPFSFHEMSSVDCPRFQESKNLLSLPYTQVFLYLRTVNGPNPELSRDEITHSAKDFPNSADNKTMQTSEVNKAQANTVLLFLSKSKLNFHFSFRTVCDGPPTRLCSEGLGAGIQATLSRLVFWLYPLWPQSSY